MRAQNAQEAVEMAAALLWLETPRSQAGTEALRLLAQVLGRAAIARGVRRVLVARGTAERPTDIHLPGDWIEGSDLPLH